MAVLPTLYGHRMKEWNYCSPLYTTFHSVLTVILIVLVYPRRLDGVSLQMFHLRNLMKSYGDLQYVDGPRQRVSHSASPRHTACVTCSSRGHENMCVYCHPSMIHGVYLDTRNLYPLEK